jgi:hypothetical protein
MTSANHILLVALMAVAAAYGLIWLCKRLWPNFWKRR